MDIDFDALNVFVVVVERGGFNAASQVLFKTQPAITASIKKLEEQLQLVLFDRTHYRPVLTAEGEKLYQRAQQKRKTQLSYFVTPRHPELGMTWDK